MIFQWLTGKPKEEKPNGKDSDPKTAQSKRKLKITKEANIGELAMEYPELAQVLAEDYGLHCVGCFASSFDTIEAGAQVHGMTEQEIDEMIDRLKRIVRKKQQR